jgi:hypothetical protein
MRFEYWTPEDLSALALSCLWQSTPGTVVRTPSFWKRNLITGLCKSSSACRENLFRREKNCTELETTSSCGTGNPSAAYAAVVSPKKRLRFAILISKVTATYRLYKKFHIPNVQIHQVT